MIRNRHVPKMSAKIYSVVLFCSVEKKGFLIRMKGNERKVLKPSTLASTVVTYLYIALVQHSKHLYLSHRMQLQTYDSQNGQRLFS
jgi:hypothetical protein